MEKFKMERLDIREINNNLKIIDTGKHKTTVNGNTRALYIILVNIGNDYEKAFKKWEYESGNSRDLKYYCIKVLKEAFNIQGEGYREYEIMMESKSIYRLRDTDLLVFNKDTTTGSNDLCIYDLKSKRWVG